MNRFALLGSALMLGCGKPLASEKTSIFPTMNEVAPGVFLAFFRITMGVDETTRDAQSELEMNVGGLLPEGTSVDADFSTVLLSPIPTFEPDAHTGNVAIAFSPGFDSCDGDGYELQDDGGCEVTVLGTVTLSNDTSPRVGFIARVLKDGFEGSADDVSVDLSVEELEPE